MNCSQEKIKKEPIDCNEEICGNFGHSSSSTYFVPSSSIVPNIVKNEVGLVFQNVPSINFPDMELGYLQNQSNLHFPTTLNMNNMQPFSSEALGRLYWPNEANTSEYFSKFSDPDYKKSNKNNKELASPRKNIKRKPSKTTSPRKKIDRFNGIAEEDVAKKFLPDHIDHNLDIVIIGINPGLFAAHKGHHYAGPGNHFWKCLFLSGLIPEPFTAYEDFKMLEYGIGFTNMVARTTRGSADLSKKEISEGGEILLSKLKYYQPKVAVFNGKGIYEIFSKKKDFSFGKQPEKIDGTNTHIWVMPSSSARCAQLPRAIDKVPFYLALKKLRDHLNGKLPNMKEEDVVFKDLKLKNFKKEIKQECKEEV